MAVLIQHARGRTRVVAHYDFEFRIRWIRREIFVGINLEIRGMIDCQNTHLIEVHRFLQRFHKAEAEIAVFLADGVSIDLDVLDRTRNVALPRPNPVPDYACAQHVGDKFVALAIPHK